MKIISTFTARGYISIQTQNHLSFVMEKFKNKYRIPSARLPEWEYNKKAAYFITICTKNREHFFGEIIEDEMQLSELGVITKQYWLEIPFHFPFIKLGEFVVMPNHIHGILIVTKKVTTKTSGNLPTENQIISDCDLDLLKKNMSVISPKKGSISTIIRSFKSAVTKDATSLQQYFAWQPRFHDHIIRSSKTHVLIQQYIRNNPKNWKEDKFRL